MDPVSIDRGSRTILAPFTPFLINIGKAGAEKSRRRIGQKGGETAWEEGPGLWGKIKARFDDDLGNPECYQYGCGETGR